jgi:phage terminase large subunit-like protein
MADGASTGSNFRFTPKQEQAQNVLAGDATHVMLFGGGRSGKTFLNVRNIVMRALKAPKSRHLILRFRFNHVKASIIMDTFPKVMALCYPQVKFTLSHTDWYARFPNGAEIWFGGLDEKERTEKLLGSEYVTIYLNECSQISWASREMAVTRLSQLVMQVIEGREPRPMKLRMYYDCNPPSKAHWTFRLFRQKVNPETRGAIADPDNYVSFQMNPRDNAQNLSPEYLKTLAGLSSRMRRRFEEGEFADATPNALFDEASIDKWRVVDGSAPSMVRIVVAVDPSGAGETDNADNDEIGIAVVGLGIDGNGYVLEDCSCKAGPATWGRVATDAFDRHKADVIVGEINFGGDMVRQTIETARPRTNFKKVTASRGKMVRAEPFSALYEQGKVRHVGTFAKLEDELCAMSTSGYTVEGSPNRADAVIWALTELFPAIVEPKVEQSDPYAGLRRHG